MIDNFTSVLQVQNIPKNQRSFYHNWVYCYKTHCKANNFFYAKDSIQLFIYILKKSNKLQWQRKQIYQVVLLFFDTLKKFIVTDPKNEIEQQKTSNIANENSTKDLRSPWSLLSDKVTNAIKVKHLLVLTLKHHIGWIGHRWYWLFPSWELTFLPESKKYKRCYFQQTTFHRAYLDAKRKACVTGMSMHIPFVTHLRHTFYNPVMIFAKCNIYLVIQTLEQQ